MTPDAENSPPKVSLSPKRQRYSSPKLITYGTFRDLTLSAGRTGIRDGGGGQKNKTSP